MVPARVLDELADRARRSDDLASFEAEWLTDALRRRRLGVHLRLDRDGNSPGVDARAARR
ncbi:hypothetical protein [Streptomyces sp. NPDC048581]|uniref:hypothetical protein n=1 Tax=unclassified Streptomyces TaxID=2593676 RepID=UPI003717917B